MKVLVACEFSGVVRNAFETRGHDAWSCDLLPCERGGKHFQEDIRQLLLAQIVNPWDLMICHPPCTHLAVSGARWFKEKQMEQRDALAFVCELLASNVKRITGACSVGVKMFVEKTGKDIDATYTAVEIAKLVNGQYGSEQFAKKISG